MFVGDIYGASYAFVLLSISIEFGEDFPEDEEEGVLSLSSL